MKSGPDTFDVHEEEKKVKTVLSKTSARCAQLVNGLLSDTKSAQNQCIRQVADEAISRSPYFRAARQQLSEISDALETDQDSVRHILRRINNAIVSSIDFECSKVALPLCTNEIRVRINRSTLAANLPDLEEQTMEQFYWVADLVESQLPTGVRIQLDWFCCDGEPDCLIDNVIPLDESNWSELLAAYADHFASAICDAMNEVPV